MIIDECSIADLVCDQTSNEVLAPVQDEIQSILTNTLAQELGIFLDIVDLVLVMPEEEDQVQTYDSLQTFIVPFLIHELEQKTNDVYYEVYPIPDAYKKTGLHHNLIVRGFGIWLGGLRSPMLLIISLYKPQDRVCFSSSFDMWQPINSSSLTCILSFFLIKYRYP